MIVHGYDIEWAESHSRRARTMNIAELRLSRALVTAATVSLVVLVAQSLPVSADGGDLLLDSLRSVRSTLDKHGVSLGLQSTDEYSATRMAAGRKAPPFSGKPRWGWGIDLDRAIDRGPHRLVPLRVAVPRLGQNYYW
jgi:hypothetical protein